MSPEPGSSGFTRGHAGPRMGTRRLLVLAAAAFGIVVIGALVIAVVATPRRAAPQCPPDRPCGAPPRAPLLVTDRAWRSAALGFRLEYASDRWTVEEQSPTRVQLRFKPLDGVVVVEGVPAGQRSPQALFDARVAELRGRVLGLARDTDPTHQVLGPQVAYRDGVGDTFTGTVDTPQGVGAPVGTVVMAAGDGEVSIVATVVTRPTDEQQRRRVLGNADLLLNTVRLRTDPTE